MTKSKIIILLMFCASVCSAFAKAPMQSSSSTQRNNAAQASVKANCMSNTGGAVINDSPHKRNQQMVSLLKGDALKGLPTGRGRTAR